MLVVHISCVLERNLYHTVSEKSLKKKKFIIITCKVILLIHVFFSLTARCQGYTGDVYIISSHWQQSSAQ